MTKMNKQNFKIFCFFYNYNFIKKGVRYLYNNNICPNINTCWFRIYNSTIFKFFKRSKIKATTFCESVSCSNPYNHTEHVLQLIYKSSKYHLITNLFWLVLLSCLIKQ